MGECSGDALGQNPCLDFSVPLVAVPEGSERLAPILGLLPLAGPYGPRCRQGVPVGNLDIGSVGRLAHNCLSEWLGLLPR